MAIIIRDEHLERLIDTERQRRGHKTKSKTLVALITERMTELSTESRQAGTPAEQTATR